MYRLKMCADWLMVKSTGGPLCTQYELCGDKVPATWG
jgi:hypothetical protein